MTILGLPFYFFGQLLYKLGLIKPDPYEQLMSLKLESNFARNNLLNNYTWSSIKNVKITKNGILRKTHTKYHSTRRK